jgi:hypothetical protein
LARSSCAFEAYGLAKQTAVHASVASVILIDENPEFA